MGSTPLAQRVRDVVAPAVSGAGLYLEAVDVHPAGKRTLVRVVVDLEADRTGALDLDSLALASRAVADALDSADVVPGEHVLEVTSPGTDRPLTEPRHFARARGRLVRLTLTDGSTVTDRLVDADGESVVLAGGREIALTGIVRGKVEVELSRLSDDDGDDADGDPDGEA